MPYLPHLRLTVPTLPADPWEAVRRAPRHSDEALTGTARVWLRRLPAGCSPQQLCMLYPRVANRLAWCWRDDLATVALLDDLLTDRRGGRAGFAKPVVRELRRLRHLLDGSAEPDQPSGFIDSLQQYWARH